MSKYKEGDRVEIIDKKHGHQFEIGEVVTVISVSNCNGYECENEREWWMVNESEIKLANDINNTNNMYKQDDKVIIINRDSNNRTGCDDFNKPNGDVGKIGFVRKSSSIYDYVVYSKPNSNGKYLGLFNSKDLELVEEKEEKPKHKFKEGDIIRMKSSCSGCLEGEICELHYGHTEGSFKKDLVAWCKSTEGTGCDCKQYWELYEEKIDGMEGSTTYSNEKPTDIDIDADEKPDLTKWPGWTLINPLNFINPLTKHNMGESNCAAEPKQTLSALARRTFSLDQRALFKANFVDRNGIPTREGIEELNAILWESNLSELVKAAKQIKKDSK